MRGKEIGSESIQFDIGSNFPLQLFKSSRNQIFKTFSNLFKHFPKKFEMIQDSMIVRDEG